MSVIELITGGKDKDLSEGEKKGYHLFALGLLLSIAYSANIGGTATIIGTPPNVVLIGYLDEIVHYSMDFSRWLLVGLPVSFGLLVVTYLLLTRILFPNKLGKIEGSDKVIKDQIQMLGSMSHEEKMVAIVFFLTAFGWIFKKYINELIGANLLSDTVIAMSGGILMFLIPVDLKSGKFLMRWEDTMRMPWGILILFGGGLTLAKGMEITGLIQLIGNSISGNDQMAIWLLIVLLITTMLFMTELMSNVALATIFIPVVIGIAYGFDLNPVLVTIPVTIAASCAFMMPISTPPNAIVFASGRIKMMDMMRAGFILNIVSIILLVAATFTIIEWVFK
jgi:sodium-dependent dicarboxylate transporter 2/3/5